MLLLLYIWVQHEEEEEEEVEEQQIILVTFYTLLTLKRDPCFHIIIIRQNSSYPYKTTDAMLYAVIRMINIQTVTDVSQIIQTLSNL